MTITEERVGDVVVLRLSGRMTVETFGRVKEAVQAHVDRGVRRLVLNLQDVPYADSIGIAELVRAHSIVRLRGGRLKLCSPSRSVQELLTLSQLSSVLDLADSQRAALAAWS